MLANRAVQPLHGVLKNFKSLANQERDVAKCIRGGFAKNRKEFYWH